jgi:sec-independent protein translocase protein TatA
MAFGDPLQWIIIGIILVVIFLWGPQKIPELARAVGRARKEYENASKEMNNTMSGTTTSPAPEMSGDQALMEAARKLGINTVGKSREQISQEIVDRARTP